MDSRRISVSAAATVHDVVAANGAVTVYVVAANICMCVVASAVLRGPNVLFWWERWQRPPAY